MNRETWLNLMANKMAPRFKELGHPLPKFHVAIGFPSSGKSGNAAAECWNHGNSEDGAFQIYIRPDEADAMMIAGHLAHELTHAAVGFQHKHKGDFAKVVLALGLMRPLTSTVPGDVFKAYAQPFLDELGTIPHARLSWSGSVGEAPRRDGEAGEEQGEPATPAGGSSNAKPKQKTRLLKVACKECGYTVRVTAKWLEIGPPHCPEHGAMALGDDSDA